jgi:FtsH-binding integral membrane protein
MLLVGVEQVRVDPGNTPFTPLDFVSYPWTHSLFMVLGWSVVFGVIYGKRTGYARGAWTVGALVLSHWVLDFVTHRPDLPLAPGATKVGLGLWYSVPATAVVESGLFVAAVLLYARATRARTRTGSIAYWAMVSLLVVIYVANIVGTPPPSQTAIAVAGLLLWLFVPWAVWVDRNRETIIKTATAGAASTS